MRHHPLILALVLVLAGGGFWWRQHSKHPPPVNASEFESDMTEGLLRNVLREFNAAETSVCFVAFGEGRTPPHRAFIARLADCTPEVQSCGVAESPPIIEKYFDKSTGRPGVIIHIVKFRQIIPGLFDVVVAFSNLPPGHDRFTYRIAQVGGEWLVRSRKPN